MATRSRIGLLLEDNSILSVYHHWDGYPEGLGAKLVADYDTKEKVAALIDGGDISTCMSRRTWDGVDTDEQIVLYYTERGDTDVEPAIAENDLEFIKQTRDNWGEYAYAYNSITSKWSCYDVNAATFVDLYKNQLVTA